MTGTSSKAFIAEVPQRLRSLFVSRFIIRQISSYAGVGCLAAIAHYGLLIGLVELLRADAVTAALFGFGAGGYVSYRLNRRHTFQSDRPHRQTIWRFCLVAFVGFCLTFVLMRQMAERNHMPYLLAQIVTTLAVMVWTFAANRAFTFGKLDLKGDD
jgi:putative flippase GtrA